MGPQPMRLPAGHVKAWLVQVARTETGEPTLPLFASSGRREKASA